MTESIIASCQIYALNLEWLKGMEYQVETSYKHAYTYIQACMEQWDNLREVLGEEIFFKVLDTSTKIGKFGPILTMGIYEKVLQRVT